MERSGRWGEEELILTMKGGKFRASLLPSSQMESLPLLPIGSFNFSSSKWVQKPNSFPSNFTFSSLLFCHSDPWFSPLGHFWKLFLRSVNSYSREGIYNLVFWNFWLCLKWLLAITSLLKFESQRKMNPFDEWISYFFQKVFLGSTFSCDLNLYSISP